MEQDMVFPDEIETSMNTSLKNFFLMPALIVGVGLMFTGPAMAQTFTTLYNFLPSPGSNINGANLRAGLILSGNRLYGTACGGGTGGVGTVFAVNTDGTGITNLHSFTACVYTVNPATNSDGANPSAGLILSGNRLYGTACGGGTGGVGTVFAVNTDGTGFTNLHTFTATDANYGTNSDGARP
jgi:uncharacterized repeat protein (TIGR03803 family)